MDEKEILIKEIDNYEEDNSLLDLCVLLNDQKERKKVLINNTYGLIGNILNKYINKLDYDILKEIIIVDLSNEYYFRDLEYVEHIISMNKNIIIEKINKINILDKQNNDEWIENEFSISKLKSNKKIALQLVKFDGNDLQYLSKELRNDKDIVIEAIKQNPYALRYASSKLQNDINIINIALEKFDIYKDNYKKLIIKLNNKRLFILETVKRNGFTIQYATPELKNDQEIVYQSLLNLGYINQTSKDKNVKDLYYEAVKQNGSVLEYAPEELQNDKYLVLEAIKQDGYAFKYASKSLQNDKDFVLNAVKIHGNVLKYASEELKKDKEVVLEAIKQDDFAIVFANEQIRKEYLNKNI